MSLFAIADTHLSLGTDKPMDIFKGWSDYVERLEKNWRLLVKEDDTVVIAGDISWAMKLEECEKDFTFLENLPGKKIILKGNHDYWWATKKKMDEYIEKMGFKTLNILFNNSYSCGDFALCGTRGWCLEPESEEDTKVLNRELGRLKTSIDCAKKLDCKEMVAFFHYPPVFGDKECTPIIDLLIENGIKKCYYGHLHGSMAKRCAVNGIYRDIEFRLISCDNINFTPFLVR